MRVVDDLCRMLASGKNVVNTSFVPLLFPQAGFHDQLQRACLEGGTSFTLGIDPGYGNAGATIPALALCKEVSTVRMAEIVNYATWDNPFTMFEIMGFGKADASQSLLLSPGSTALAWGPVVALVAEPSASSSTRSPRWHGHHRRRDSPRPYRRRDHLRACASRIRGMVGGEARIVVEHVTRPARRRRPEWPQGAATASRSTASRA